MAAEVHHLRAQSSLFRQGLIACLVFMTPVFAALYALTVPDGAWRLVLAVQIVAMAVIIVSATLFFRAGIWVDSTGLRERGYFGRMTFVPVAEMDSVILADTFTGVGAEVNTQLFVCDKDGKQLVRMRGQFWSKESMDIVIATLDLPYRALDDAVSQKELRSEFPGLLYWFERRPIIAALAITAGMIVFGVVVLILLELLGLPTS